MDYIEITFYINPQRIESELLVAELGALGFESFLETNDSFQAYIPENLFDEKNLKRVSAIHAASGDIRYSFQKIEDKNWNEVWESNYKPVLIKNHVFIRAPFHEAKQEVKYEIIIEPKMSFGTAHHETTALVIELMLAEDFRSKSVLDMGCGTGVLAILAEKFGASEILAVDNDNWAYENALGNCKKNKCKNIRVELGDAEITHLNNYNVILANINRNVLLKDLVIYTKHLKTNGVLILSGFYEEDIGKIQSEAGKYKLQLTTKLSKNNWAATRFTFKTDE
ncbi:MAG: 50S ribosomal protein L11 methyltransferase [Bacteroidales bacterium]|nr:50S ribosomal protein L11 methyltransferase [Bacteroidales bacterium]